jgi:hypothetical protein
MEFGKQKKIPPIRGINDSCVFCKTKNDILKKTR